MAQMSGEGHLNICGVEIRGRDIVVRAEGIPSAAVLGEVTITATGQVTSGGKKVHVRQGVAVALSS